MRRSTLFFLASIAAAVGLGTPTWAQDYPTKPIHIIVPAAAGGGTDTLARYLADALQKSLDTPIVVENKPGAGGGIGAEFVRRANPDGYTLLMPDLAFATAPMMNDLDYDPVGDFTPITQMASQSYLLVVPAANPAKSVQEFVKYAKESDISCASPGIGSAGHLAMQLFKLTADFKAADIQYSGTGPATVSVVGEETQCVFSSPLVAPPLVEAGKIRVLGVTGSERMKSLPDIPTIAECGYPGYEVSGWKGVVAPKGTSPEIVKKLYDTFKEILSRPDIQEVLNKDGSEVVASSPEEFGALLVSEKDKWTKVIESTKIQ